MTTNSAPPGWHPDPSNPSGAFRWWDGNAWTEHTQPAAAPVSAPTPPPAYQPAAPNPGSYGSYANDGNYGGRGSYSGYSGGIHGRASLSFAQRNSQSLTAIGVVAVYIVLALSTRIVFIGILPVLMASRALRRKEALAPLAMAAAIVAVAVAFLALK